MLWQGNSQMPVIIDCCHINQTDFTAAKGFKAMLSDFQARSQAVYWLNPTTTVTHVIKFIAGDAFHVITSPEDIAPAPAHQDTSEPLLETAVPDYGAAETV